MGGGEGDGDRDVPTTGGVGLLEGEVGRTGAGAGAGAGAVAETTYTNLWER